MQRHQKYIFVSLIWSYGVSVTFHYLIKFRTANYLDNSKEDLEVLDKYLNNDINIQSIHDTFSENTLSNFYFPFSVAPNFLINNKNYCLPMVIEESSVIAAA